ncbi:DUF6264 family protein [Salinibacterium sp. SWN1162]|uniref:DUF6264 family protein n=1 Tax=Salinibacterium sp. SWN1162 TaxID=2792053 RepID=UPI0018CD6241|nr:DUF6264 family protein [Salinibacterium sp. SWN1162]MBH0010135.1 hypothetical protein [Salinibacterium sp. SWN1162]
MTDPRPRPKYGEYAPLPPAAPEGVTEPSTGAQYPAPTLHTAVPHVIPASVPAAPPERPRRMWDVLLTATLLLFGVVDVINGFGTAANLGPILREGLAAQGFDGFTADEAAAEAGAVANIVRVIALVLTIVFALIQIQRTKIAFWIPLVGATIATIALFVAIFVAVLSDPGFMTYVDSLQQQ